jgi:hypothetical protein
LVKTFSAVTARISTIIAEAGVTDRLDVSLADVSTLAHDLGSKTHRGIRLCITGVTGAIEGDLLGADLGEVQAEIFVRREAVVATIHLCGSLISGVAAGGQSEFRRTGSYA